MNSSKVISKVATILMVLLLSNNALAITDISSVPVDVGETEVTELESVFSDFSLGKLFTVNFIPASESDKVNGLYPHKINSPGSAFTSSFGFLTNLPILNQGDAFEVSRKKRIIVDDKERGKQTLIIKIEFVRKGTAGKTPNDKFYYQAEQDVTTVKYYDERAAFNGLTKYFDSVAHKKSINSPYAGQSILEKDGHP